MTNNESLDFSSLVAESSLGSQGAQELISRSDPTEVSQVLETAGVIESLTRVGRDRPDFKIQVEPDGEGAWRLHVTLGRDFASPDSLDIHVERPGHMSDAEILRGRIAAADASSPAPDPTANWLRVGFVGVTVCDAAGITRKQLDYWDRTGLVKPSLRSTTADSDDLQRYSFRDVLTLKVIKRLLGAGISLQQIRAAVQHLQERGADDLTRVTLMSDGASVYECTSNDEVIDLLQSGQGVFGIAIGGVWREVAAKLSELTGESTSRLAAELAEDVSDESLREDRLTSCWSRDGS